MTNSFLLCSRDASQVAAAVKSRVLRDENNYPRSCASFLKGRVVFFFCMFEP